MKNINTEKQLGMAWYKFLIYFALFAGAVLNFIYGVNYLSGGIYYSQTNGQITSEIVYAYYGEVLKFLDIVMGFSLIALSVFGLILRQKLVKYSLDAPKLAYVFYSLSFGLGCIYSLLVSTIIAKPIGVSEVCSLVINGVFGVFNIQYFRKRAHLFVGINPSVCHSEPVSRLKTEEHPEENLFSDNTVRINLSPADQKQKIEVSEYHIYGSDVKLDKDVQFENSCPIAEQSNYTYDSTYNPFAEKNSSSSVKQKYCSRCGCLINDETKKCTGCGRQYFKLNVFIHVYGKVIINVVVAFLLIVSVAMNIYFIYKEPKIKYEIPDIYKESREYWINNHNKVDFIDEFVVFIEDDGTDFYHKYECDKFVGDYFWAYNIEAAEYNGYRPCPLCHED